MCQMVTTSQPSSPIRTFLRVVTYDAFPAMTICPSRLCQRQATQAADNALTPGSCHLDFQDGQCLFLQLPQVCSNAVHSGMQYCVRLAAMEESSCVPGVCPSYVGTSISTIRAAAQGLGMLHSVRGGSSCAFELRHGLPTLSRAGVVLCDQHGHQRSCTCSSPAPA